MNNIGPDISVLIVVHNGLPYIEGAIRSMMSQTLTNIEIILVDDASTDNTPKILADLAIEDSRIHVETLSRNLGPFGAANHGLALARAPYIARLDGDDWAMPQRLEIQKRFLDSHPDVVLAGTSLRKIDDNGNVIKTEIRNQDPFANKWISRLRAPLIHPTIMFRRQAKDGTILRYDANLRVAQDYEFCVRALQYGDVVSLPDVLVDYRIHGSSISLTKRHLQNEIGNKIATNYQRQTLPENLVKSLQPVLAALYTKELNIKPFIKGLRDLIAYDIHHTPAKKRWVYQHSADLTHYVFVTQHRSWAKAFFSVLRHAPDFILALICYKISALWSRRRS